MLAEPEAIHIITKYNLLTRFGSSYTFSSIDDESYLNIQLMEICKHYEDKSLEMMKNKTQFYEENLVA